MHDNYGLSRFLKAQEADYAAALAEIRHGKKQTHWMWYIFPQLLGLSSSSTARFYSIKCPQEARAYLIHPVLGSRLVECAEAILSVSGRSAEEILGYPDVLKLNSCATLFALVSESGSVFHRLQDKFYAGESDRATLRLSGIQRSGHADDTGGKNDMKGVDDRALQRNSLPLRKRANAPILSMKARPFTVW